MKMASPQRNWNANQKVLRQLLESADQFDEAIQLFLSQHSALHTAQMGSPSVWSFEDEVLNDMEDAQIRRIPESCEHSVAWTIWHIARIEDTAMNMLVAGRPQLLVEEAWLEKLKIEARDTGNMMSIDEIRSLSNSIHIESLRAYRSAVGQRTREVISQLNPGDIGRKVDPGRLQRVLNEGAVVKEAQGLIDYWGRRTIAGLLLMPATRHNFVHLNEALKLKHRKL